MATVISKTYPAANFSDMMTDVTNAYEWTSVDTTTTDTIKLYVDTDKYVKIYKSGTTYTVDLYNGDKYVALRYAVISSTSSSEWHTRFATCKSGVMLQFDVNSVSSIQEYSPMIIIGTATNPITNASEKVIFFDTSVSTSNFTCGILSSDNKTAAISTQSFPYTKFSSKLTTAIKLSTYTSEFVMDNALFMFNSELSAISHGSVMFGGKNYYMMSGFMLED